MIWAVYSLKTDLIDKRRTRLFFILATVVSLFSGTLLPLELVLFLLCPLLFLMHLVYTGVLFGVFQAMHGLAAAEAVGGKAAGPEGCH